MQRGDGRRGTRDAGMPRRFPGAPHPNPLPPPRIPGPAPPVRRASGGRRDACSALPGGRGGEARRGRARGRAGVVRSGEVRLAGSFRTARAGGAPPLRHVRAAAPHPARARSALRRGSARRAAHHSVIPARHALAHGKPLPPAASEGCCWGSAAAACNTRSRLVPLLPCRTHAVAEGEGRRGQLQSAWAWPRWQ